MNDKELAEYLVNLISPLCTRESVPVCRVNNNGTPVDINLRLIKELAETFLTTLDKKQEAFQAGRKAGLGEARERLDAMVDEYSVQADNAEPEKSPANQVRYFRLLDRSLGLREGASAVEALVGGGGSGKS